MLPSAWVWARESKTGGGGLKRRGFLGLLAAGLVAGMLATSSLAAAFSTGATFKVGIYSSAVAVDGAGRGWLGLAFDSARVLYGIASDGNLYKAGAMGAAPVTMSLVGAVGSGASGLAFGLDGKLYAATPVGVLEIDPANPATRRMVAAAGVGGIPGPDGLAIDPVSGDLFVTSSKYVYWIANPASATAMAVGYTSLRLSGATVSHGISINGDGTLYVSTDVQIWRVTNPHALPAGITVPTPEAIVVGVGLNGVAVVTNNLDSFARYVYTSTTSGAITRYPVQAGGAPAAVVTGGDRGDFMTVGPDRCVYATQGGVILRISRDDGSQFGTCNLAAPTTPPATLALSWSQTAPARIGALQIFQASVMDAALPDLTPVVFTVAGANSQTVTVPASGGRAAFAYAGASEGTDTIVATTAVAGGLTSNPITVLWGPAFDPIPPVITYTVTGTQGLSFQCILGTGPTSTDSCGYYVTAPTVTWTVVKGGTAEVDLKRTKCDPFPLTASTGPAGIPVTCRAYNTDGAASSKTVVLQALLNPPVITALLKTADGQLYLGGPTNQSVTATFTCTDEMGPSAILRCDTTATVSTEGAAQTVSGTVGDAAGRLVTVSFGPIFIDKTAPTISVTPTLPGHVPYVFGNWTDQDVTLTYSCADSGIAPSGIATTCLPAETVTATTTGFTRTARDVAGNIGSVQIGAINIDRTAPIVIAAATINGVAYNGARPTNQTVIVTFTCTTAGARVTFCPPAQSFSSGSTFTATGTATNEFGRTTTATFGPFTIDMINPTVSVRATIGTGSAATDYVLGSWVNRDVTLTYTCSDASGMRSCPPPATVSSSQAAFTNSATDAAGNVGTVLVPAISIDKTPPTITATATAGGVAYNGTSPTNKTVVVTFTCGTDGAPVSCPTSQTFTAVGPYTASATATDRAGNTATTSFGPFAIVSTLDSALTITSPAILAQGSTALTARLTGPDGAPVAVKTVTFTVGTTTVSAVTNANGVAKVTPTLAAGQYTLTVAFAGDSEYFASHAGPQSLTVGAATTFVIWGGNPGGVQIGQRIIFWGEHWWDAVTLGESAKVKDFKGYADAVTGLNWTTKPGNSKPPQSIASYISVIVTANVTRSGGQITGDIVGHVILRVDSNYRDVPAQPVYGVVVALVP